MMLDYTIGEIIHNTYRIEERIGEGSFGEVYRVTHLGLKVGRAIKILKRDAPGLGSTQYADFQQRFQLEAQLGARLNSPTPHPNLLQVHHFHQGDDLLFLEMEYAPGGSLAERIARARKTKQPIPIDEAIQIGIDITSGLAVLHEQDIVHRDVKPSNILFDDRGRAKVADLGLAQIPGGASMRSQLSEPEPHPGTPAYMSIEQKDSRDYLTSASDVYSLGAVLFEMLAGRIYSGQRASTRARSLRSDVPKWLDDLIARMLSENPQARPWDGAEVAELLRQRDGDKKKCLGKFPRWVCWGMFLMIGLGLIWGGVWISGREVITPTAPATWIANADTPSPLPSIISSSTATVVIPSNTKTPIPSATPSRTATNTFTAKPVYTSTKTPKPTATHRPTSTPEPTLTAVPVQAMLYSEDFEDGEVSGWNIYNSTWSIEVDSTGNHYWRGTGPVNYPQTWYDNDGWTDYAFEVRFRFASGTAGENQIFICTRTAGGSKFNTATISTSGWYHFAVFDGTGYDVYEDGTKTFLKSRWYLTRVEVQNNNFRLFIDDQLLLSAQNDILTKGSIGFYMLGDNVIEIDNIRVWELSTNSQ